MLMRVKMRTTGPVHKAEGQWQGVISGIGSDRHSRKCACEDWKVWAGWE